VRHITAHQRNHVAHYPSAVQVGGLGLGGPVEPPDADAAAFAAMVDGGWEWLMGMSARLIADALSLPFDRLVTRAKEKAVSSETITLPGSGLVIEAGSVGGVRWTWDAYTADDRVFLTIVNEQTGVLGLGPGWRTDDAAPAWTVELDASPPMVATIGWPAGAPAAEANAHLNAARAINFLPALVAAPPGCRSVLDLPMITCSDAS